MNGPPASWSDALASIAILSGGAGGVLLRARSGPAREEWLAELERQAGEVLRVPPGAEAMQLRGGRDLLASLSLGQPVHHPSLDRRLEGRTLLVCGAERVGPELAAYLAELIDGGVTRFVFVDESEDSGIPAQLAERTAMTVSLEGLAAADCTDKPTPAREAHADLPAETIAACCHAAAALGIEGCRAEWHALRVARAALAFAGPDEALELASRLALAPRARQAPPPPECETAEAPPEEMPPESGPESETGLQDMEDRIVEATRSVLPDLPEVAGRATASSAGRSGRISARRKASQRGRPGRRRPGMPGRDGRLDMAGTILAAAARGAVRKDATPCLRIGKQDIRIRAFRPSRSLATIFAVDTSGSAALARLAEVKGAIEHALARSYSRRDNVALVAFRDQGAQTAIPCTRSLARARRELAALPAGGPTPLAAGLVEALAEANRAEKAGFAALIVVLTDGGANIALNGEADRETAREDGEQAARAIAESGIPAIVIDSNARPSARLRRLATAMHADCVPLPRLDDGELAHRLDDARTS